MITKNNDSYDAVIIGAGLSGLVCGCYLAKAGMKVLIAEQHHKPGGYCTSFKRGSFTFDAAAHSFGGYRKDGIVKKVFTELGIGDKIKIKRYDPSDIIISPDYRVSFWADLDKTIENFQSSFPAEHNNIDNFFHFLTNPDPTYAIQIRSCTFANLLDKYFTNDKLKAILSFPLFGNGGLPPSLMSAFTGVQIFSEFLIDGGYYPEGGMQSLPNALADRFKELGGELRLSYLIKRIKTDGNKVSGILSESGEYTPAKYVISNCDIMQTFLHLLDDNIVSQEMLNRIRAMTPSLSMFILYLGLSKPFNNLTKGGANIWFLPHYNLDEVYASACKGDLKNIVMVRVSPDHKSVLAFANTSFINRNYWKEHKEKLIASSIKKIEQYYIPELSKHIIYKDAATPFTLYRYTLNYNGAAYGWASVPSQFAIPGIKNPSFVHNLFSTGHWVTLGSGIPAVVYIGYNTANLMIKKQIRGKVI
jgi:phytoene dehydrogenase-like protein